MFTKDVNVSWYCSFVPGKFSVLVRRFESKWGLQSGFPRHFCLFTGEWGLRPEACIEKRRGEIGGSKHRPYTTGLRMVLSCLLVGLLPSCGKETDRQHNACEQDE